VLYRYTMSQSGKVMSVIGNSVCELYCLVQASRLFAGPNADNKDGGQAGMQIRELEADALADGEQNFDVSGRMQDG